MAELPCPHCGARLEEAGRTDRCTACDGAWIHEDVLVGMLQERTSTMVFLPWHPREAIEAERGRTCPVCTKPMTPMSLGTVALDRCSEHGVWFDATELASLIKEAKQFKAEGKSSSSSNPEHSGILGALAKLFG
jgi:Zn-finger nucleic acid-binding protein